MTADNFKHADKLGQIGGDILDPCEACRNKYKPQHIASLKADLSMHSVFSSFLCVLCVEDFSITPERLYHRGHREKRRKPELRFLVASSSPHPVSKSGEKKSAVHDKGLPGNVGALFARH